jgi:hypothetical protein
VNKLIELLSRYRRFLLRDWLWWVLPLLIVLALLALLAVLSASDVHLPFFYPSS